MPQFRRLTLCSVLVVLSGLPVVAQHARRAPGLYATLTTSRGTIIAQLFPKDAPKTVQNFVGLVRGTRPFRDIATGMIATRPFYDGLLFFRTISGFIIQTGDPSNRGTADVGFVLDNESNNLRFDRAGRLSMAQVSGDPKSRAVQFFITLRPAPELDRQHFIVFGQVVQGLEVARAIASGPHKKDGETPLRPAVLKKVVIEEVH